VSDEQQLDEPEVKVVKAVQTLDELLQYEDAMWTKVSQPQFASRSRKMAAHAMTTFGAGRCNVLLRKYIH
jgi:hypothetical protein